MSYGFSDANLGWGIVGIRKSYTLPPSPPPTAAQIVAGDAQRTLEAQKREAYRAAVSAEATAITEEQKAAALQLRLKANSYDDTLIKGIMMGEASLAALEARTTSALNTLYYDARDLKITPESYAAQAKILNDNYEAESKRIVEATTAAANAQAAITTQALYDQGASDAKWGTSSTPKIQLNAERQEIYNMGFYAALEEKKIEDAPVQASPLVQQATTIKAQPAPSLNVPLSAAPPTVAQAELPAPRMVSQGSLPTPVASNPVAVLRGSGPLTLVNAPPMASVPAYAPMTNSLTASQAVQQASIGGADLKTVAMIAVPLIVLGLILRR